MEDLPLLHDIAHELEAHPNSLRIHKLLFYICKNRWENDPQKLQIESLFQLINDIFQSASSPEQLKQLLDKNVKTLNKRTEYALVANVIFQKLKVSYLAPVTSYHSLSTRSPNFREIAQALEQESNLVRIKKLLLYACRNTWENDPTQLAQISLLSLLAEIREVTASREDLKLLLSSIVNSLNRRAEYTLVADTIIQHLSLLYEELQPATQFVLEPLSDATVILTNQSLDTAIAEELPTELERDRSFLDDPYDQIARHLEQDQPNLLRIHKLLFCACNNYWENDPEKLATVPLAGLIQTLHTLSPSLVDLQSQLEAIAKTLNHRDVYLFVVSEIVQACIGLYPASPTTNQFAKRAYQAFDLRLEVMKYTNPLRAKILIFSVVEHQFLFDNRDWFALKNYDLDTLLKKLFDQCETLSDLMARLEITASCLAEPEEYNQAAGAIFQCLKPFYPTVDPLGALPFVQPQAIANQNPDQTSISHFAEATQLNPAPFFSDDDNTCQFFSTSPPEATVLESSAIGTPYSSVSEDALTQLDTELLEPSQACHPSIS